MKHISVQPFEIWEYFEKNKTRLATTMYEIASNEEYGVNIYVTAQRGFPLIVVYNDDDEVYTEEIDCEEFSADIVQTIYDNYLTDDFVKIIIDEELEGEHSHDGMLEIKNRELELDDAVYSFVDMACIDTPLLESYIDDEMLDDIKEHFLEYLFRKWGLPIYRPMYLEDDKGEFYEEYPYRSMIFGDEDNPIYK